jgi:lipopolysaccharide biosynthesis glycosyltransferase
MAMPVHEPVIGPVRPQDTLVFFAADPGYAFAMYAAATSFRQNSGCDDCDVMMFAVDFSAAQLDRLRALAAPWRISVEPMDSATFVPAGAAGVQSVDPAFHHLNIAALARLAAWRAIPDRYMQALYIDGDTWCAGSMVALVTQKARAGVLHATPDPLNFYMNNLGGNGARTRAYRAALGLAPSATYYSSGVLLGDLAAWRDLGEAALAYFFAHPEACRLFDQSALNGAVNDRLAPMSLRWNFTTQLRVWGLEKELAPRIVHFAGAAKPWLGPTPPWADYFPKFEALRANADAATFAPPHASVPTAEVSGGPLGSLKAMSLDRFRNAQAHTAILAAERNAPF